MKKILNFITDHRFIIGIQAVLSIILVVSIALVNILPMRFLIVIGAFLAILTLLMYLFAKPSSIESRNVQIRPLIGKIISVVISIFLLVCCVFIQTGKAAVNQVTSEYDYVTYSLVVKKESPYYKAEDILNKTVAYNPNGTKTKEEITKRCVAICDELISHDVKAIVIACNTATSACVKLLREKYDVDIIGMEPALKVACDRGEHQRIAVWATQLTLSEKKFANLMNRFKDEHHIIKVPCPELVRMVEDNKLDDACLVESCLKEYLAASDYKNLDSIVLGCTHFPFYTKYLEKLCPNVHIIEGSVGTTLHTKDLLEQKGLLNTSCEEGQITWMNTMDSKIELSKCLFKKLEVEL